MSLSDQKQFMMITKAPDHLFLNYIRHYIEQGGKDLRTLCSLSSVMNRRCNQHRATIRNITLDHLLRNLTTEQLKNHLYWAIRLNEHDRFEKVLEIGGDAFKQSIYENNNQFFALTLDMSVHTVKISMLQRIFQLIDYRTLPDRLFFSFIGNLPKSEARATYILSLPGIRDRLWNVNDLYQDQARLQIQYLDSLNSERQAINP